MDGVHDLGGMHGFGPVEREANEPVFHARWEAVVYAIMRASMSNGLYNLDEFRHGIERMDPAHYLRSGYYEHWLDGIARVLLEKGVVSAEELERRTEFFTTQPDATATVAVRAMPSGPPPGFGWMADPSERPATAPPRFAPGEAVVTRHIPLPRHTRLPRYARGRRGGLPTLDRTPGFSGTDAHAWGG